MTAEEAIGGADGVLLLVRQGFGLEPLERIRQVHISPHELGFFFGSLGFGCLQKPLLFADLFLLLTDDLLQALGIGAQLDQVGMQSASRRSRRCRRLRGSR